MKRRTLVALVVTAVVIGGLLLLFPAEWVGLLIALVALLTAQAVLILRHTRVLPYPPGSGLKPVFSALHSSAQNIPQDVAPRTSAAPMTAMSQPPEAGAAPSPPPETAPAEAPSSTGTGAAPAAPSADVFSRFRAHLETMEQGQPRAAAALAAKSPASASPTAGGSGAATDEVADQVQLSPSARKQSAGAAPKAAVPPAAAPSSGVAGTVKPPAAPKAPAAAPRAPIPKLKPPKPAADEEEGPDLFADLRPALAVDRAGARDSARADKPAPAVSAAQDEVGQALARAREPQHLREESAALIRIAQEALDEDNLPRAKAVLGQHASLIADAPNLATLDAARAELRLAAREGRAEAVAPAYQSMLDRGYAPAEGDLEADLDALLEGLPGESRAAVKAASLAKALAPFRQAGNRAAMDRIYDKIEAAQESAGDPRKLIQSYKNHLAIKEALGDTAGRLSLIDKIGNRYFQLGESAPAREFYEMGMKLRLEQDVRAAEPSGATEELAVTAPAAPGTKREGGG